MQCMRILHDAPLSRGATTRNVIDNSSSPQCDISSDKPILPSHLIPDNGTWSLEKFGIF